MNYFRVVLAGEELKMWSVSKADHFTGNRVGVGRGLWSSDVIVDKSNWRCHKQLADTPVF